MIFGQRKARLQELLELSHTISWEGSDRLWRCEAHSTESCSILCVGSSPVLLLKWRQGPGSHFDNWAVESEINKNIIYWGQMFQHKSVCLFGLWAYAYPHIKKNGSGPQRPALRASRVCVCSSTINAFQCKELNVIISYVFQKVYMIWFTIKCI